MSVHAGPSVAFASLGIAALLLAGAGPLVAQEAPHRDVQLSSVVTLPVPIPGAVSERAGAGENIRFEALPEPGFRPAGEASGVLDLREGDLPYLPLTLSVGPDLPAGPRPAARVVFHGDTAIDTATVSVNVLERTGMRLSIAATEGATAGSRLPITFELTNHGNVSDTVSFRLDSRLGPAASLPERLAVPPFATVSGEVEIDVSPTALPMPTLVVVRANGARDTAFATTEVPVQDRDGLLASFVQVPTRLFVGSSVQGSDVAPAYGLEAEGLLRRGVRLRVEAHDRGEGVSGFAFRGLNVGPRFRARLDSRPFSIGVGDVTTRTSPLAGYNLQGRGAAIEAGSNVVRLRAHAARPLGTGSVIGGNQIAGGVDILAAPVRFGAYAVTETRRDEPGLPAQGLRTAYVRMESAHPSRHGFEIDAGWARLEDLDAGIVEEGPAIAGRYGYRDAATIVDFTLRRQPMLAGLRSTGRNEVRLSAVTEAPRDYGLTGQLYRLDGPRTALVGVSRIDGGEAGVFLPRGGNQYGLRGRIRRLYGAQRVREHTIEGRVDALLGVGTLDGRLEFGRTYGKDLERTGIMRLSAGYNLRSSRGWGRLGVNYFRDAFSAGEPSLDISGAYRFTRKLEVHGSYGGSADRLIPGDVALAQLGVQYDARSDLSLLAGIEKSRGSEGSGVRFSIGVRKGLPLPIPFPQEKSVQGTVFEDLDGNGRRAPDEPYLDGVRLTMGAYSVTTRRGYFVFPSGAPREMIEVELSSLGPGFLPPQPIPSPDGDRTDIPVHRAASVRVDAYFDRDRDGERDPTDMPLADIEIEIAAADRPGWVLRTGDDGGISLDAVRPGGYVVRVNGESLPRRAAVPELLSFTLAAGEAARYELAIPARPVVMLEAPAGDADASVGDADEAEGGSK